MESEPSVSVAIPAHDAEQWIGDAVGSALNQTWEDLEVVVVDDASTDETPRALAQLADPRLRVERNPENLGHSANWNRAISLCRAPLVKFLSADDRLHRDCVERMAGVFREHEGVGLVFSRRTIELDDPSDPAARAWAAHYSAPHLRFGRLERANHGRELFRRYLATGFDENWVGEPTNVMMARTCLERVGGFSPRVVQAADNDLWIRAMLVCDVGFLDEELATYRLRPDSLSVSNQSRPAVRVDRLWMLEDLLDNPDIGDAAPEIRRWRRWEYARALKVLATFGLRRDEGAQGLRDELRRYLAHRRAPGN